MLNNAWSEAIDCYTVDQKASGKPRTTTSVRRQHLEHLARRVDAVTPWALTFEDLRAYVSNQEWAQETRRGRRNTFKSFYLWAIAEGLATENLGDRLPTVRVAPAHARPAPDRIYHEALMSAQPRDKLMLRLAAEVGMRRAEVAQGHSKDLFEDLVGYSLLVHGKGGRRRTVPLPNSLGRALAHLEPGFFFPGRDDGHLSPRYVGKIATELLPDGWTMHTLRHRFATRAYALQSDILLVQEMLGHASPTTTRRYVQYDRNRMRAVVEELAS